MRNLSAKTWDALSGDTLHATKFLDPHPQAMAAWFRVAASVAAREALSMVFVQRRSAPATLALNFRVGSSVPIIASSTGWAYIADISDAAAA
jgi:DNA-binding IclR family transcriptional regulator